LNELLHPRIKEEIDRRRKEIGEQAPEAIVVIDAPLLVETGDLSGNGSGHCGCVHGDATTRTAATEGWGNLGGKPGRSFSAQMALAEKINVADHVIRNENSLDETRRRTKEVFKELKKIVLQKKGRL